MTATRLSTAQRISLSGALGCLLATGLAVTASTEAAEAHGSASSASTESYTYRFVSSPDFLNADVGDTRESPLYGPGDPNSTNARYEKALDTVLDAFESTGAQDVLVAGDLVNGHWGLDTEDTGIFGPTNTFAQRRRAVIRAGALYYDQWRDRFTERGMQPLPALGDHEIGDNPWHGARGRDWYLRFKQSSVPMWKENFGRHLLRAPDGRRRYPDHPKGPASETAYAHRPSPEVQVVSLDVFKQTDGDVVAELDRQQLVWLRRVLAKANRDGVDWTVVQGHTPIVGPVKEHGSSGLMYRGGTSSRLWKTLRRHDVDLYLCGEVHDITARQPGTGDPVQISHGGLFAFGGTNFMVADLDGTQASIVVNAFRSSIPANRHANRTWQTDNTRSIPTWVKYNRTTYVAGAMTLSKDGVILARSGKLAAYRP